MIEVSQGQPQEFQIGFSVVRIWVNENVAPRVYFGNFSLGKYTIYDWNSDVLDLCGVYDSIGPNNVNSDIQGYYDVLNFVWYQGVQNLFQGQTGNNQMVIGNN